MVCWCLYGIYCFNFFPWNHHGIEWWQYPRNEDFMNLVYNAMSYLQCNDTTVGTTFCDLPCLPWTLQDTFWNYISREDLPQGLYPWLSLIALSEFISWSSATSIQKNLLLNFFQLWTEHWSFSWNMSTFFVHIFLSLTKTQNRNPRHRTSLRLLMWPTRSTRWIFSRFWQPEDSTPFGCHPFGFAGPMAISEHILNISDVHKESRPPFFLWRVRSWIC